MAAGEEEKSRHVKQRHSQGHTPGQRTGRLRTVLRPQRTTHVLGEETSHTEACSLEAGQKTFWTAMTAYTQV